MPLKDTRVTLKGHISRIETQAAELLRDPDGWSALEVEALLGKIHEYEKQLTDIHHQLLATKGVDSRMEKAEHLEVRSRIIRVKDDLKKGLKLLENRGDNPFSLDASSAAAESTRDPPVRTNPVAHSPPTGAIPKTLGPSAFTTHQVTQPHAGAAGFVDPVVSAGPPSASPLEIALAQLIAHQTQAEARNQQILSSINSNISRMSQSPPPRHGSPPRAGPIECKLPTLSIPEFDGDRTKWQHFKDMFRSIIHANTKLSDVQRLHYLMSYLAGNAKRLVANVSLSSDNYAVVWDALCDYYDDTAAILHHHIEKFCKLPTITHATATNFADTFSTASSVLNSLDAMNQDGRDPWVIHLLLNKLDHETKVLWSRETANRVSTLHQFFTFLKNRLKSLELCGPETSKHADQTKGNSGGKLAQKPHKANVLATTTGSACPVCKADHKIFRCSQFRNMSSGDRYQVIRANKLCRKCLTSTHMTKDCAFGPCQKCSGAHNSLLHDALQSMENPPNKSANSKDKQPEKIPPTAPQGAPEKKEDTAVCSSVAASLSARKIFLETVVVEILDRHGVPIHCRALLDCGAQANLIAQSLFQRLKLPKTASTLFIGGVVDGGTKAKHQTECLVRSRYQPDTHFNVTCQIVSSVLQQNIPNWKVDTRRIPIPDHLQMADPTWHISQPIELLIGNEFYNDVVAGKVLRLGHDLPVLKETVFGWVVSGPCAHPPPETSSTQVVAAATISSIDASLKKLCAMESLGDPTPPTPDQVTAEFIFKETTRRNAEGRYVVHLPLKPSVTRLHNNLNNASRQFLALERRLEKNDELKSQYHAAMQENLDLKFFEEVPDSEINNPSFYMPHHCVAKNSGGNTKIRVVMNASSKSLTGLSLNDVAITGPTVQPDILTILLRFREKPYALSCDIQKMYPQVHLHPRHRDYHRILWRFSPDDPIKHYRAIGVCFGVSSSPFLATRVIVDLGERSQSTHPLASQVLLRNFYVDDCLASFDTLEEAQKAAAEMTDLLGSAGMTLAKWNASHAAILEQPMTDIDPETLPEYSSTLGMSWQQLEDRLSFKWNPPAFAQHSKRTILATVASLYDPLGLLGPLVVRGKLLMQACWKAKLDWDDPLPEPLRKDWSKFLEELPSVQDFSAPRCFLQSIQSTTKEIHIFADSSDDAYGAVAYAVTGEGTDRVAHLIMAKSRLAPPEPTSTPKLELSAAVLAARVLEKLRNSIDVPNYYLWSDSTSALGQIRSRSMKLEQYFLTRVIEILNLTDVEKWHYVPSSLNPADIISRGMSPRKLMSSSLWWHGPSYITGDTESWPHDPSRGIPEAAVLAAPVTQNERDTMLLPDYILSRSMDYRRVLRIVAYTIRAVPGLCKIRPLNGGPISLVELQNAEEILIRHVQETQLDGLKEAILDGSVYTSRTFKKVRSLCPFVDEHGYIRVGGRLSECGEPFDFKHPLILPNTRLAKLIVRQTHLENMHPGPQLLLSLVSQRFWILDGKRMTRATARKCVKCWRHRPTLLGQRMGNLPADRIEFSSPFNVTSVDFCGPVLTRPNLKRGGKSYKTYICVFVCCATKAVHIEVVGDLTTDSFLAALRRFCSRRSAPSKIICDNATNLRGADAALKALFRDLQETPDLENECSKKGIVFKFIPPRSPHHGGLHEAAVKSLKYHLRREVGNTILTFEELTTVMTQIEAILNSRPLTPLPSEPGEPAALCPGHFLALKPLIMLPSRDYTGISPTLLKRWHLCQRLVHNFANRFKKDYLRTQQKRSKWIPEQCNLKVGDIVLLADDCLAVYSWPLAIVEKLHPGPDGLCRVATVRTAQKSYTRAIQKLSKLPIEGLPPSEAPPAACQC